MVKEKTKITKGMIGVCGMMLQGKNTACCGDYLGKDNLCDNPFESCLKLNIEECEKKGYIKIEHDDKGYVTVAKVLKTNEDLEIGE